MTQKELEQKVIDAEGRVAKREAVLKKHNSQLAKMIEKGADRFDINIKREDIKSATSKLAEARETLANWQDKLNTRITRDAYLEANTPEILKDFLESWKRHAIGYYQEKRIRFIEYREGLKAKERAARLNAVAVTAFLLDGPETLLRHIGLDERDTYTTKHEIDDLVTVVHITREEAPAWQH